MTGKPVTGVIVARDTQNGVPWDRADQAILLPRSRNTFSDRKPSNCVSYKRSLNIFEYCARNRFAERLSPSSSNSFPCPGRQGSSDHKFLVRD